LLNDYEGEYRPGTTVNDIEPGSDPDLQRKIDNIYAEDMEFARGGASEVAFNLVGGGRGGGVNDGGIAWEEGYSPDLQINVPQTVNSGVTIAGLDFGSGATGSKGKLEIIKKFLGEEDYAALETLVGLTGDEARTALEALQAEGRLTNESMGLTQKQLNQITALRVDDDLENLYEYISEEDFKTLPIEIQRAVSGVFFVGESAGSPSRVSKAIKSGKIEDWQKAYEGYRYYYGAPITKNTKGGSWWGPWNTWLKNNNLTHLLNDTGSAAYKDAVIEWKIESGKIGRGNQQRVERAANAILNAYPKINSIANWTESDDQSLAQN
jgi:hypothetical protein